METTKIGYVRVSTDNEGKEQTIEQQVAALERYGVKNEHIFADKGVSGSINLTKGAGWLAVAALIDSTDDKTTLELVVVDPSRISRDFLALQNTINQLNLAGIGFTTTDGRYTRFIAQNTMELFQIAAEALGAALFREKVRVATKAKLDYLKSQGVQLGRPKKITDTDILRIKDMRAQGHGYQRIATALSKDRYDAKGRPETVSKALIVTTVRALESDDAAA